MREEEFTILGLDEADNKIIRMLRENARTTMRSRIKDYPISNKALKNLQSSGICYVQDLYRDDMNQEPGWYAVRELFDQILAQ